MRFRKTPRVLKPVGVVSIKSKAGHIPFRRIRERMLSMTWVTYGAQCFRNDFNTLGHIHHDTDSSKGYIKLPSHYVLCHGSHSTLFKPNLRPSIRGGILTSNPSMRHSSQNESDGLTSRPSVRLMRTYLSRWHSHKSALDILEGIFLAIKGRPPSQIRVGWARYYAGRESSITGAPCRILYTRRH